MTMVFVFGVLFLVSVHPMFMVMTMIVISIFCSFICYLSFGDYWFGYLLVMVMLSGVLVIFFYMSSLLPNEMFEFSSFLFAFFYVFVFMSLSFYYNWVLDTFSYLTFSFWESFNSFFNLFLVSYLFVTMLMVVWLSVSNFISVRVNILFVAWLKD